MTKLARAKALADEWAWQEEASKRNAAIDACFAHTRPHDLVRIWETGKTLDGKKLTDFEFEGLVSAWLRVFGVWPPFDEDDNTLESTEASAPEPELPSDDTMLKAKDVVRITGVSLATLKRKVLSGDFPAPMRLSPRRIGWPARDVRLWLERLDGARQKTRT